MKKCKSIYAVLLALVLIVSALPVTTAALDQNYKFVLAYPDIQCHKNSRDQRYHAENENGVTTGYGCNDIEWQTLLATMHHHLGDYDSVHNVSGNAVYLAKNEREGFQIYFYEGSANGRSLRVEVTPFMNESGAVLPHTLYKEAYFTAYIDGEYIDPVADALVPYNGEAFQTQYGTNDTIYLELHAPKDQSAGNYVSTISLFDGDALLRTETVTAVVWNFALPDSRYSSFVSGMYDTATTYKGSRGFLELSGIHCDDDTGEVLPEDRARAEEILEGWTSFLLDHGVTTLELPRWLIDDDPKAAELAMADPRRKAYAVPLVNTDFLDLGDHLGYDAATEAKILQYKNLAYNNPFLRDKAFFYVLDERAALGQNYTDRADALDLLWPGSHNYVPFNGVCVATQEYLQSLRQGRDILCPTQSEVIANSSIQTAYSSGNWFRAWRYPSGNCQGSFELYLHHRSTAGSFRRLFFWQQNLLGGDGMYYWNCAYTPRFNDEAYNPWTTMTLPGGDGNSTGNGNGMLVYPGTPLGLDAATPVPSLRLMQINDGLDDYDYLQLAKEFLGEDSEVYQNNTFVSASNMFNFDACLTNYTHYSRIDLGNALEAAAFSHNYGAWETAVEPDETHDGLQIRTCADCGAEDSRALPLHTHTFSDWTVLTPATCTENGFKTRSCTICGETESAEILSYGHDFTASETAPTCTEPGVKTYICMVCLYTYSEETHSPYGHDWGAYYESEVPDAHERVCSRCDEVETEPHEWDDYANLGIDEGHSCTCLICGAITTEIHCWTISEDNLIEPTETEEGSQQWNCVYCSASYTEILPRIQHTHQYAAEVTLPTCTESGFTTYTCETCGDVYTADETPALGHDYLLTDELPRTCTQPGYRTYVCSRDPSHTYTVGTPASGHCYTSDLHDCTCTEDGYTTYICEICGDSYIDDVIPAVGHFWDLCGNVGLDVGHERICGECGFTETVPHEWGEWVVTVQPTAEQNGLETCTCSGCGAARSRSIPKRIAGDADADGELTLKDVTQIARYIAGGWENVTVDPVNADVNGDGKVTLKDVTLLRRYMAGWPVTLV